MTNIPKLHLSASRFYVASACAKKYEYQYEKGLRKKAEDTYRMELGRVVHELIARVWQIQVEGGNAYDTSLISSTDKLESKPIKVTYGDLAHSYFIENKDKYAPTGDYVVMLQGLDVELDIGQPLQEFQDMVDSATEIVGHLMEGYLLKTYIPLVVEGKSFIEYELKCQTFFEGYDVNFHGFVDFVGYNFETGTVDLVDWKTRTSLQSTTSNVLNPQLDFYAYFLEQNASVKVDRVVEYQVRSKAPEYPKINKNGTVSKAKCTTTTALYTQAILDSGGKLEDYQEQLDTWVGSDWIAPIIKPTNKGVQVRHVRNAVETIARTDGTDLPRSTGWQCQQCPFSNLCEAYILGYNEDAVIEELYERKWQDVTLDTD